eukprot:m.234608 g.234608  ORF g.234608 m.234608 type:complete len:126 (+) comp18916_c5_seq5:802-1179(+)
MRDSDPMTGSLPSTGVQSAGVWQPVLRSWSAMVAPVEVTNDRLAIDEHAVAEVAAATTQQLNTSLGTTVLVGDGGVADNARLAARHADSMEEIAGTNKKSDDTFTTQEMTHTDRTAVVTENLEVC